ncbi:hypothetical protein CMV30_11230 [Nibricoccus aquaticus]|uniref:TonB C-terminal domain-containing protein n=1 Tax=Nibricoccus aquaticus TaxID=2576891 RepID=A0A290QGM2_9BACT|nr:TonB family protein [Nibricoccus aquaticus]ATC64478.1 hypothetical protein CMV30_11230 [Nibricoccus aquaticus]
MAQLPRALIACASLSCIGLFASSETPAPIAAPPQTTVSTTLHEIESLLKNSDPVEACIRLQSLADQGDTSALFALGYLQEMGAGLALDEDQSLHSMTQAAERGNKTAAGYLAWKFEYGFLTKRDLQKAARFLALAGDARFSTAPIPEDWLGLSGRTFIPKLARAFLWLGDAASEGDRIAQFNLAQYYFDGRCSAPDFRLHIRLLRQSADKNFGPAALKLSLYYRHGLLTEKDAAQARHYLHIAAEAGVPRAMYALSEELLESDSKDTAEGLRWLELAAIKKHPAACLDFGRRLRGGDGIPKDERRALEVFQSVVDAEDSTTIDEVAYAYEYGRGTAPDLAHARTLYEKSAARGSAWAKYRLGMIALENPVDGKTDHATAIRWLEAAARDEQSSAMVQLGAIYQNGIGVPADPATAFMWYERAAREGRIEAQKTVAWYLLNGTGIERDDEEAFTWHSLAAKQGDLQAGVYLAWYYLEGRGVEKSIPAALDQVLGVLDKNPPGQIREEIFGLLYTTPVASQAEMRALLLDRWAALAGKSETAEERLLVDLLINGPDWLRDPAAAIARLQHRCDEKNLWAMETLTLAYVQHHYVPHDYKASYALAQQAAALPGKATAAALGFHQAVGFACEADEPAGLALLEAAAPESGFANYLLAQFHALGFATPENLPKARQYLLRSAELNFQLACSLLHRSGHDPDKAVQQFGARSAFPAFDEALFANKLATHLTTRTDSGATPFWQPPPIYPSRMRILDQNGEAVVRFELTVEGRTQNIQIIKATHPEFATAAIKTVEQWRFLPSMTGGKPVQIRMQIPLIFNLREQ